MAVMTGPHERTTRLVMVVAVATVVGLVAGMAVTAAGAQSAAAEPPPELVILARSDNPADALAAGPVGGVLGAPVLLTPASSLHPAAADAIRSIDPDLVIIAGGPVALSAEVELAVINLGYPTQRAAGGDRHETAAIVAGLLAEYSAGRPVLTGAPVTDEVIPGLNAARLGGKQAGDFLGRNEKAADAEQLDGKDSAAFAGTGHDHLGQTWTGSGSGLNVHAAVPGVHEAAIAGVNTDTSGTTSSRVGIYGEATGADDHMPDPGYPAQPAGVLGRVPTADGFGVFGTSGDVDGLWQPVGNVGVAGVGQSRGMYASGSLSYGIYATSLNWYGIYGRTSRTDHNYGLYTPDNLYARNVTSSSGTFATVMQNDGSTALEPGDVVVFSGLGDAPAEDAGSVAAVTRTSSLGDPAVAGVVLSRFDPAAAAIAPDDPEAGTVGNPTPDGPVSPGSYLLVVVAGPAQVNATAEEVAALTPGDLVTPGGQPGHATALARVAPEIQAADTAGAAVLGKVLGRADGRPDRLWVYVGPH